MGEMDKELPKTANIGWNNVKKGPEFASMGWDNQNDKINDPKWVNLVELG